MTRDWYDHAHAYDVVFDVDTPADADGILALAERHLDRPPRRVLEPACGSGRLVRELARRGLKVTGLDVNGAMLRFARGSLRREGLRARVVRADMRRFQVGGEFDVAHCLISSFKHLARERDAVDHLRHVARSLRPGGIYILGFHLTDPEGRGDVETWSAARDGLTVRVQLTSRAPDLRRRRERMELRLDVRGVEGHRRIDSTWWFRTYTARQVERLLARVSAFSLVAVTDFDFRDRRLHDERLDKILVLQRDER